MQSQNLISTMRGLSRYESDISQNTEEEQPRIIIVLLRGKWTGSGAPISTDGRGCEDAGVYTVTTRPVEKSEREREPNTRYPRKPAISEEGQRARNPKGPQFALWRMISARGTAVAFMATKIRFRS